MLRWTVRLEGGPRRVNHAAVAIGDKIYSFGGYCTGEDYETTRPIDVHVFDTITLRWSVMHSCRDEKWQQAVPYQRYGHTCVTWNGKAFIWGGRNDRDGACNVLYCFDPTKAKTSRSPGSTPEGTTQQPWSRPASNGYLPGARDGHSACVIRDAMYIFGGYEEDEDRFSNEIHRFCFLTMTWSYVITSGTPASWRDFHSATPVEDRYMIVFGGRSDYGAPYHTNHEFYCQKVHVFDTQTKEWSQPQSLGDTPSGRRSHSAFVHENLVYIFGGFNGNEDRHYDDLWSLDPHSFVWKRVHPRGGLPPPLIPVSSFSPAVSVEAVPPIVADVGDANVGDGVAEDGGNLVNANQANNAEDALFEIGVFVAPDPPTQRDRAPCARRRQCCCVVKDTVILFGGTSPAVPAVEESEFNLKDHSDLYVLDFYPSLKTLCLLSVVDNKLDTSLLPRELQWDILSMTTNSNISRPLANNG